MHPEHFRRLERMYAGAPINRFFRPQLRIERGLAEVTIPVRDDFFHAAAAVHGAVYFKALDDAAFFAVNSVVEDTFVLTVSMNVYLLRPISAGAMRAVGKLVHRSQRLFIAEAELFDSDDKLIARGSGTFMRSTIALDASLGYA